jgi:hypothetical protein
MADESKVEYLPPPEFQTKSPLDYTKISPGGVGTHPEISEQFRKANQATEDYAKSLEDRFARPNWFKIAAGFAKPQLGGFLASLGSASEEFGKQQEAARAIQPSISRMRAEVAAGQLGFSQRMAQKEMFDKIKAGEIPMTAETLKNLGEFGTGTDIYKAASDLFSTKQTIAGTKSTEQATSAREQELMRLDPYYIPLDPALAGDWKARAESQNKIYKDAIIQSGLYNPEQVAQMNPGKLQETFDAVSKQQAEKRLTDTTASGQVLSNSMNTLSNLSEARNLATSPGMEKLLGIGAGQDAVSALFGYIANNDQGNYSRLGAAAQKLQQSDPEAYAKFVVLQKALNTNIAQARELVQNPSNQATGLLQSTYPNVAMPQKSIVTLLDLMAAQNMRDAQIAALRQSDRYRDVNPNKFETSPEFMAINEQLKRQKNEIAEGKYYGKKQPQEFYSLSNILKPASQSAPAAPAAPQGGGRRLRTAEDILREAGVQ